MDVKCTINGKNYILSGSEDDRLRDILYRAGFSSVRDSDDREGFAGSDTIVFNGKLKYSNFILLYQAEGAEIRTAEGLLNGRELNYVLQGKRSRKYFQEYSSGMQAMSTTILL